MPKGAKALGYVGCAPFLIDNLPSQNIEIG